LAPRVERSAIGTAVGAFSTVAVIGALALLLNVLVQQSPRLGPGFAEWPGAVLESPVAAIRWFFGDMTEPQFYKSDLAAGGLLAGAGLAWWASRRNKRWGGAPLSYGTGLWPWILTAAALSLLLSNIAFDWTLSAGWQPTFVPFVCVASALVLVYGRGWKVCLTGAVLGAATTTPVAMLLIATVSTPLGLPPVVSNVLAMSFGATLTFLIARKLPWLSIPEPVDTPTETHAHTLPTPSARNDVAWAARRVLSDYTETQFFANELASIGVILGVSIAFVLNPALPSYGSNLVPHIIFAQALTSAIGVVVWRRWYRNGGWAPTYVSLVSVAPAAVLTFNGSWLSIVGGAVLGAVLAPPVARTISARLPKDFHPFIGNTLSMAISTAIILPTLGFLSSVIG
jgi:hypothetical protein